MIRYRRRIAGGIQFDRQIGRYGGVAGKSNKSFIRDTQKFCQGMVGEEQLPTRPQQIAGNRGCSNRFGQLASGAVLRFLCHVSIVTRIDNCQMKSEPWVDESVEGGKANTRCRGRIHGQLGFLWRRISLNQQAARLGNPNPLRQRPLAQPTR